MKLTQNQFFGLSKNLPLKLPEGSTYICVDTFRMYVYNKIFEPVEITSGESSTLTKEEIKSLYELNSNTNAFADSDKAKLDSVEEGATGDLTGSEIKQKLFSENDTNNFDDTFKDKLKAIEDNAKDDQTGAEIKALYEGELDTNPFTDADVAKLSGIEANATADMTASEIKTAYESNADTNVYNDSAVSKLAGIEDNATADQTGAEIESLLDAELGNTDWKTGGDSALDLSSTETADFNASSAMTSGLTKVNSSSDVTVTVQDFATSSIPVGSVLVFLQEGEGNILVSYSGSASGDDYQTYKKGNTLTLWHESQDSWVTLNPPRSIDSRLDLEPAGAYLIGNIVGISQANYDAGTPLSTTTYLIE